jgi:hypothetical protein
MLFAVKNPHIYQTNASVHGMNRRQQNKPRVPLVRHYSMQRGVHYSTIKIFNHLAQNIFKFHINLHIFKILLRDHPVKNAFYFIEEFFSTDHVALKYGLLMFFSLLFIMFLLIL